MYIHMYNYVQQFDFMVQVVATFYCHFGYFTILPDSQYYGKILFL